MSSAPIELHHEPFFPTRASPFETVEGDYSVAVGLLAAWIVEHADAIAGQLNVRPASILKEALNRIRSDAPLFGLDDAGLAGPASHSYSPAPSHIRVKEVRMRRESINENRPLSAEEFRRRLEEVKAEGRLPTFGDFLEAPTAEVEELVVARRAG